MPIRDTAAMNASLDNDYGATHGPNAPASHDLALFDGDPMVVDDLGDPVGVELDATANPGYARVTILNDASWATATDGAKQLVAPVQLPDATAAWDDAATHWALFDGSTMWDCGPLTEPLEVTSAGPGPLVSPVIFYADSLDVPA